MLNHFSASRLARLVERSSRDDINHCLRMLSSAGRRSDHYETLGVNRRSTQKEIRAAYVKLSKQHHPDLGGSAEKFAALNRAYQVLSNERLRKLYDGGEVSATDSEGRPIDDFKNYGPPEAPPAAGSEESEGYYGIRGVRRMGNSMIALLCFTVVIISGASQLIGLNSLSKLRDEEFMKQSAIRAQHLADVRERYRHVTSEDAIKMFEDKYEAGLASHSGVSWQKDEI